jgi:hypothetical protein
MTWLVRACLLSVGIVTMENLHGWPRLVPAFLLAALLVAIVIEEVRKRRGPPAVS